MMRQKVIYQGQQLVKYDSVNAHQDHVYVKESGVVSTMRNEQEQRRSPVDDHRL